MAFFAARTFAFKLGQGIAMIIFTSLAVYGASGYRISLIIALIFSVLAAIALFFYKEKDVMETINKSHEKEESSNIE